MTKQIRVLHSLGSLYKGGIETWLMNILRQQPSLLKFDFLLGAAGGDYELEAKELGAELFYQPPSRIPKRVKLLFGVDHNPYLYEVLKKGNYDVFHYHGEELGGESLKIACKAGIPVRVNHCHNTQLARGGKSLEIAWRRFLFRTSNRRRLQKYATDITACSNDAGRFLMGQYWDSLKLQPLYCGVSCDAFHQEVSQSRVHNELRKKYQIPEDAIVVGHVGSMHTLQKNHFFMIDIFQELYHRNPNYWLFLAGDGILKTQIIDYAKKLGVDSRVVTPGVCNAVELMVYVFDVFLFPSCFEGFGLAIVEAVAGGLYTVCSDVITNDLSTYFPERMQMLSLHAPLQQWADAVESAHPKRISVDDGCQLLKDTPFSIESSAEALVHLYQKRLKIGDDNE